MIAFLVCVDSFGWLLYVLDEVFAVPLMVRGYAQIAEPANISPSLEMVGALGFKATLFV